MKQIINAVMIEEEQDMYYSSRGISDTVSPNDSFAIFEEHNCNSTEYSYPGRNILYEIDDALVLLYDLMRDYVFGDAEVYYELLGSMPIMVQEAGYDAECGIDADSFNQLLKHIRGKKVIERNMMLVDLQFLIGSIQNLILAADSDFMNFFVFLSKVSWEYYKDEDGIIWTSGKHCSIVYSLLTSYITKAYSILDILTKLAAEFEKDPGSYSRLTRLRSKDMLYGAKKWLKIYNSIGTLFEEVETNCVYQIESLRNELVHNGTWELTQKVYCEVRDRKITRRFILFPELKNHRLATCINRKRFFSTENTVNEWLIDIHMEFLKRMKATVELMLTEYSKCMPHRTFEEVTGITIDVAKVEIKEFYANLLSE